MLPPALAPLLGLVVVALAAIGVAWLLRRGGVTGAPLLAGLVVGVALGPGVAGRIAPELWTRAFRGPHETLSAHRANQREAGSLAFALGSPQALGSDASATIAELDAKLAASATAWEIAQRDHRFARDVALACLAALVLIASGGATAVRAPVRGHQRAEALLHAMWWCAGGAVGAVALLALVGRPLLGGSSLVVLAASCCGPWRIGREERRIAQSVAPEGAALLEHSGRIASSAAAIAVAAMPFVIGSRPWAALAILALPIGWLVRAPIAAAVERAALPGLVAILLLAVEPFRDVAPLLAVGMYVVLEDARWLGGWLGLRLSGRAAGAGAAQASFAGLSVEPMIVAFAGIGAVAGALPNDLLASLVLGATAMAVLAKIRCTVARRLTEHPHDSSTQELP